ncbi:23390_t:CDS:1, partial [Racocetra persica]
MEEELWLVFVAMNRLQEEAVDVVYCNIEVDNMPFYLILNTG